MEDRQIIDMYFQRLEDAIVETKNKYGRLLVSVAMGILKNMEDALECENDTYIVSISVKDNKEYFIGQI